jgi:hypothetical protein
LIDVVDANLKSMAGAFAAHSNRVINDATIRCQT